MNLRTITFWALYDPKRKLLIETRQFQHQLKPMDGCVLVKMKGHYVPPHRTSTTVKGTK